MCFRIRKKSFSYILCLSIISILILINYKPTNQIYESPVIVQSLNFANSHQISNVPFDNENINTCAEKRDFSRETLWNVTHYDNTFNYLSYVLRPHSLFYCAVPKVATRTILKFITYLHIRDELIPLHGNTTIPKTLKTHYFNQIFLSLFKNTSQTIPNDSISRLQLLSSKLIPINNISIPKTLIWSLYISNVFPFIRPRTLTDPSILLSSNFRRIIFVRHPLDRLASAYTDKIASLTNSPSSVHDQLRRAICKQHFKFYSRRFGQSSYHMNTNSTKEKEEFCQKVIPTFTHFLKYTIFGTYQDDVHWKPYSALCHVCLLKYNFIGKFETIEEDLPRLMRQIGLNTNDWIDNNYFRTGKTKENYKSLYSNLNQKLICYLVKFYKQDFQLFNYRVEDYLTNYTSTQCARYTFIKI